VVRDPVSGVRARAGGRGGPAGAGPPGSSPVPEQTFKDAAHGWLSSFFFPARPRREPGQGAAWVLRGVPWAHHALFDLRLMYWIVENPGSLECVHRSPKAGGPRRPPVSLLRAPWPLC